MAQWSSKDVAYYSHDPKRKRPIAYSTVATSHMLGLLAEQYPSATISQIRDFINFDPDAIAVCDAYIAKGEGDVVPDWRY